MADIFLQVSENDPSGSASPLKRSTSSLGKLGAHLVGKSGAASPLRSSASALRTADALRELGLMNAGSSVVGGWVQPDMPTDSAVAMIESAPPVSSAISNIGFTEA